MLPDRRHWERGRQGVLGWPLLHGMVPTQGCECWGGEGVSPPKGELRHVCG